ncbi:MAG: hypothetical protein CSA23_03935 [Deltaproteobacteria bacterium]|nr:MAG: hypothetical protein CSA23_03935 [Deltaproteobacteria bacterium]
MVYHWANGKRSRDVSLLKRRLNYNTYLSQGNRGISNPIPIAVSSKSGDCPDFADFDSDVISLAKCRVTC